MSGDVTCCCSDCGRTFRTHTGPGVHRLRAHPNSFHAEKVNEKDAGLTRARWSTEELERLARLELSVGCVRAINQLLQANFPHRSVESIKSARKQSKYRALLSRCRDPVNDEMKYPEVVDEASETCDKNDSIHAWAAERLKEQRKAGRDILDVLSRGVVRVILLLPMSSSIAIHLKSLHWLPVKVRSTYKIACLCYHCHISTAPSYVTDMLHKKLLHTSITRSSSYTMPLLNRPAHSKATLGDRSFSFASSSVWNSIPNDVRCAPSLSSFKSRLKTYLFRSVYKD